MSSREFVLNTIIIEQTRIQKVPLLDLVALLTMLDVIYIFHIFFGNWKVKTEQMSFNALYENIYLLL